MSRDGRADLSARLLRLGAAALFLVLVLTTGHFHEPWADEAQSWLLARDSSLAGLWTDVLHYEGTPPLWHTLLHFMIRLGLPYEGMNIFSAILGFAAVVLLLQFAPWPLWIRVAVPFTFFLCYQYSVIARNYSVLPVLLFSSAVLYKNAAKHLWLFTLVLCLTAAVSVHGVVLSVAIWLSYGLTEAGNWKHLSGTERNKRVAAAVVYAVSLSLLAASAWPAADATFSAQPDVTWSLALKVLESTVSDAFAGNWVVSLVAVMLSLPFLRKGGGLVVFLLSSFFLLAVAVVIYSHVWHRGLLFLAWLFAMWIAGNRTRMTRAALISLAVVTGVQWYWAVRSVAYDWQQPYSGSRQAAAYLGNAGVEREQIHAVGFPSTSLQAYFPENRFANWSGRWNSAFWDWSRHNRVDEPTELFTSRRAYLLVGYKSAAEKEYWARFARIRGYRQVKHFEGNSFWRTAILEPEAFDLYRLAADGEHSRAVSTLNVADPAAADQLILGFHPVEAGAWRWTARRFSAVLGLPPGAKQNGAILALCLFIPGAQVERLGTMTLDATVNGHPVARRTFSRGGRYVYSQSVPASALASNVVPVEFRFDKAAPPTSRDSRELAAIVSSVQLKAR